MKENIYIYHTNDLHSNFRFWPRISAEVLKKRAQHEETGDEAFFFDMGDAADRVHPLIEATGGQAMTQLFNEAKVDAVTIGNNEGTTYAKDTLNQLYDAANFSVILTNLVDKETNQQPHWAEEYKIIETEIGAKIGIFGLTEPIYDAYESLGWTVIDPIQATELFLQQHQEEADFWILFSHLGIQMDTKLAELFPIDLILGAHTHHVLENGKKVADTWLACAGSAGRYLGEIRLGYQEGQLAVEQIRLLHTQEDIEGIADEEALATAYLTKGHELLAEDPITYLPKKYKKALFENSPLMHLVLDAIADFAETDVAFLNAGLLMGDLEAGKVSANDLHRILPHPIRVMHCEIKGEDIPELLEELARIDQLIQEKEPTGNGFRGKEFGKICFKDVTVKEDQVYWTNQPIDPNVIYTFATVNYLSFFPIFDMLNKYTKQTVFFPELLREVVGRYLIKVKN